MYCNLFYEVDTSYPGKFLGMRYSRLARTEAYLYGSSRLGLMERRTNETDFLMLADIQVEEVWNPFNNSYIAENRINTVSSPQPETTRFVGTLGLKRYELCNHLGNVQAVITDRTLPHNNSGTIDFYIADLLSATDYYPFGMVLPGRSLETDKYRFGFNGKEDDPEWGVQDYGMRIYDKRVSRFLSRDPLTASYPELTPYQFASNTPIQAIDLDGLEAFYIHGTNHNKQVWNHPTVKQTSAAILEKTGNIHADFSFSWAERNGLLNNKNDRRIAACDLADHVMEYRKANNITDEQITLVGYSHGGNVSIQASHILNKRFGIKVNVVTINTPAYTGTDDPENPHNSGGIHDMMEFHTQGDNVAYPIAGNANHHQNSSSQIPNQVHSLSNQELTPTKSDWGGMEQHYLENVDPNQVKNTGNTLSPVPQEQKNPGEQKMEYYGKSK